MFETFESLTKTNTRKFAPDWQGKPSRRIETFWTLGESSEGEVRLVLTTSHDPDSKVFRSSLTWDTLQPAVEGSPFMVSTWGSDHEMVSVARTKCPRYSQKALEAEHALSLATVASRYEGYYDVVVRQAAQMSALVAA